MLSKGMPDWGLIIAIIAIAISIFSLVGNWRHSESLFRRKEYPAVAWYQPKILKEGHNTVVTTDIRNNGPKNITSIFLSALLCRGFVTKAWCKSDRINDLPIGEPLTFHITKELEKDISERFSGLFDDNGWQFKGKPKRYKITFRLEYLPFIPDTQHFTRKAYYLIKPVVEDRSIKSWELRPIPEWQGWLPWF